VCGRFVLYPTRQAIEISGRDGGPIASASATLNITELIKDSALAQVAEALSLAMTKAFGHMRPRSGMAIRAVPKTVPQTSPFAVTITALPLDNISSQKPPILLKKVLTKIVRRWL
jgi:hypothetical protein